MDVRSEMLKVRRFFYERVPPDLEGTAKGYLAILGRAQQLPEVPYADISRCMASAAMVLHEANFLPLAIRMYDQLLERNLNPEMKTRVLQNKGIVLLADHQYVQARDVTREAIGFAELLNLKDLQPVLEENLSMIEQTIEENPPKIIVLSVKDPLGNQRLEELVEEQKFH